MCKTKGLFTFAVLELLRVVGPYCMSPGEVAEERRRAQELGTPALFSAVAKDGSWVILHVNGETCP